MKKIFFLFIIFIFIKKSLSSLENITNIKYYKNQICSYNGIPIVNETNGTVECICDDKYANEPREEKRRYVQNNLIQCSYRKKKRFTCFFLAAITPFGLNFFYLEYYLYCVIFAVFSITTIVFNFISMVLNYQLEKKNEEAKRQIKIKKSTNKFDIRNLAELNDRCVKSFNLAAKILIIFMVIFWLANAGIQFSGWLVDHNGVPTEDDMNYLFEFADK